MYRKNVLVQKPQEKLDTEIFVKLRTLLFLPWFISWGDTRSVWTQLSQRTTSAPSSNKLGVAIVTKGTAVLLYKNNHFQKAQDLGL